MRTAKNPAGDAPRWRRSAFRSFAAACRRGVWLSVLPAAMLLGAGCGGDGKTVPPSPDVAGGQVGSAGLAGAPALAPTAIRPVPFTDVTLEDSFWQPRFERNRRVTIPHILRENEQTGRVANFEKAAGLREGPYEGRRFNDTDVYKAIEAASYALAQEPDPELEAEIDRLIELIAASQQEDGYLFPALTIDPEHPAPGVGQRWQFVSAGSHELYNAGHLIEAAVAHYRATGKRTLLQVAVRLADRIDEDFGPEARHDVPGHEEIELALVKLADVTGERRYLELARFFLEQRGRPHDGEPYPEGTPFAIYNDPAYKQDQAPVTEQATAQGHAVRATYLYTAMADVAARTDTPGYREALERIWRDIVAHKLYVTGSIGARGTFESFGEPYELPDRAYGETCAAVGFDLFNQRMFLSSGRAEYLDVLERTLYNGLLAGVSQAGDSFFYTNVLVSDGRDRRAPYFEVACCPANLARLMALLPGFLYAQTDERIYVALYAGSRARVALAGGEVELVQRTEYPWDGHVRVEVIPERPAEFELALRVPGWARGRPVPSDLYRFVDDVSGADAQVRVRVNGEPVTWPATDRVVPAAEEGFVVLDRRWRRGDTVELELPMRPRLVAAHPAVADHQGEVAIQRGPIVYAAEAVDNGGDLQGLRLAASTTLEAYFEPRLFGGAVLVRTTAERADRGGGPARRTTLVAIPYFAWGNREPGAMRVWLPAAAGSER